MAALVISSLINTYVESSTVAKVKKGISILGQAKKLAETQNGPIEGWDFADGWSPEAVAQLWRYLKPHIVLAKDCGTSSGCYQNGSIYLLNGNLHNRNYETENLFSKFVLNDGSVMWMRTFDAPKCTGSTDGVTHGCALFYYDVNGSKKPNTIGRDIFAFVMAIDGVYPNLQTDCNKDGQGWGCSSYILKNSNMNYLH